MFQSIRGRLGRGGGECIRIYMRMSMNEKNFLLLARKKNPEIGRLEGDTR